jgi:glycosyltransferase involved in cell wall biosynthesis
MKSLRILMIAPQPVFTPRGTPFSVVHRCRALIRLGHEVDLVTYPFGEDPGVEGLRILRCRRPLGVHGVPVGPSVRKLRTDLALAVTSWKTAMRGSYDMIHTHEEAGVLGVMLRRRLKLPHLYDMHSSLPQQFHNFGRYDYRPVVSVFERLERFMLDSSDGLIVICDSLGDRAREVGYEGPMQLIENTLDFEVGADTANRVPELRERLQLGEGPVVVYTGTLERYQGLDLLLEAIPRVARMLPSVRFLIVGGSAEDSAALGARAAELGVRDNVLDIPAVPPDEVHVYQRAADILVTTRTRGTNTPLKLYQYLRSGRPMVATSIFSHTQVLDDSCAELVKPDAESIAAGILRLADDPARRDELVATASALAREHYSEDSYYERLQSLLARMPLGGNAFTESAA